MEMLKDCEEEVSNWSDLEGAIGELLNSGAHTPDELYDSLRGIQREFSNFLNLAAPPSLLDQVGNDSMENSWGINSLEWFINDLDEETYSNFEFPQRTEHYDLFNFVFVNFNYTSLLDGYIYLDQEQFDPHPYRHADRNFSFRPNPRGFSVGRWNESTVWSAYGLTDVIHPHGQQSIPRSLLFGVDSHDELRPGFDSERNLRKPYWAQNDVKFAGMFSATDLFIVFGSSLGESDGWWWRRIFEALTAEDSQSELLIYTWHPGDEPAPTKESVRGNFLRAAGLNGDDQEYAHLRNKIHVVVYSPKSSRIWLNTSV